MPHCWKSYVAAQDITQTKAGVKQRTNINRVAVLERTSAAEEGLEISLHQRIKTVTGGNGNHSVSLPIILIKIKVDQMLPSSYISSLLAPIL